MPTIINGVTCRTREESLRHIISQASKGKIGPKITSKGKIHSKDSRTSELLCRYEYASGNNCAIGSLFSPQQLRQIKKDGKNDTSVSALKSAYGQKNLEAVTGLTFKELDKLQSKHDDSLNKASWIDQTDLVKRAVQAVVDQAAVMLKGT